MNKSLALILVCSFFYSSAFADGQPDYAAKNIPPALLPHANSVIRDYYIGIDIISPQEVTITEHYVITVLNDKGDKEANHVEYCSKLNSLQSISGYIYDANGEEVKKIKQSDFIEIPASMRPGEFSDARFKAYNVSYRQYPYTVEYNIETKQNHTFYLPEWSPQADKGCAVQFAELIVATHGNTSLKYKAFHFEGSPAIKTGDAKQYKWMLRDVHAEKAEPLSFDGSIATPSIILAVDKFMLNDYKGSTDSWKDFGAFVFQLNKGRDSLPDEVITKARQMVANTTDAREKIKILYAYLQNTMRYVSVTYGIGGWQTLDACYLSKNQYGDCKALSNYMMALLSAVGITAYPVLITAGDENPHVLNTSFVCSQFNHCILCIPFAKDTTWLECTSNDLPANYLSDFTQNRDALMIAPTGGVLVHTPVYDTSVNLVSRHANVACTQFGTLKISMSSTYTGEAASGLYHILKYENDHDKEEYLHSKFHLASYTLENYNYSKVDTAVVMCIKENAMLTATGMFTKTGNRSFLLLDIAPIHISSPEQDGQRINPFHIPESNAVSDTFEVTIPENADVEYIPPAVSVRYPFGNYSFAISRSDNKLIAICRLTQNSGTYEAAQYENYVKFANLVDNKSHKKVVLKNKS